MAHSCPECGQACYCGGDIDDCCFEDDYYTIRCEHCPDGCDDDYEIEDPDDPEVPHVD